jgi:hypothetical protein
MKTRTDLITATILLLNTYGAGQTPEPEDIDTIDGMMDGKLAELNRRDVYWSADVDEFDDEFIDPLSIILANQAAPTFGQPRSPDSAAMAERTLQALKPSTYVPGSVLAVDYF